jgi:hypothetical protein
VDNVLQLLGFYFAVFIFVDRNEGLHRLLLADGSGLLDSGVNVLQHLPQLVDIEAALAVPVVFLENLSHRSLYV